MTVATVLAQYNKVIKRQYYLNLPSHDFWTTTNIVDPVMGSVLEYADLKLRPSAQA